MAVSQARARSFWLNAWEARVHTIGLSRIPWRVTLCLAAALWSGWVSYRWAGARYNSYSDFAQIWFGARALLTGESPYSVVGPGRTFDWPLPLLYPLPAVLLATPLAMFPLRVADAIFMTAGAFALAWAVTRDRLLSAQWWVFGSIAFLVTLGVSQWSPLLIGAATVPALGFILACKPTIGFALWLAYPSRRAALVAGSFVGASLLIWPPWLGEWWQSLTAVTHMARPIEHVRYGGPLILLALLKWRRPEARLLAALACVPQSMFFYEALPLFLVVRRWYEGLGLCILNMVAVLNSPTGAPRDGVFDAWVYSTGDQIVLWMYLPCVAAVLCRPNVSPSARVRTEDSRDRADAPVLREELPVSCR